MKATKNHVNRKGYNWLVYNMGEKFLTKNIPFYRGVLYDLGCGTSPYKDFFLQYANKYVGVDWAQPESENQPDIVTDLSKPLPIDSNIADTVISISVLEHLKDPQNMLNEANRILRPGGNIVLQVPWQWHIHEHPHDYFRFSKYGLHYLFEKAGFKEITIEPQNGFFTMLVTKFNYFTARFVRGPLPLKWSINILLSIFWGVNQSVAPILDKLDRNWSLETSGYFVHAIKQK